MPCLFSSICPLLSGEIPHSRFRVGDSLFFKEHIWDVVAVVTQLSSGFH